MGNMKRVRWRSLGIKFRLSRPKFVAGVVGDCARSAEWNIKRQRERSLVRLTDPSSRRRFRYEEGLQAKFDTRKGYMDYGLSALKVKRNSDQKKCGIKSGLPSVVYDAFRFLATIWWIWGRIKSVRAAPHCLVEIPSHAD